MTMLQTVTGEVPLEQVRLADAHSHVWISRVEGVKPEAQLPLDDYGAIEGELRAFRAAGGTTIIDCMPGGAGRDGKRLAELSRSTGLHIVATTGFHLQKYYTPNHWLWTAQAQKATAYFIEELTIGLREASGGVTATMVKVGYTGVIDGQTRILMEAAAEAARWTGAAVLFHTEKGENVEALLPFFRSRGVEPDRLYLCHMDKRPDGGLHRELAQAGVLLGYDTFPRPRYEPEKNGWPLLLTLLRDGFGESIALGLDMAQASMWRYNGGPGLLMLPEEIIPRLRAEGIDEATIASITGQNVARRLVRRPPVLSYRSANEY